MRMLSAFLQHSYSEWFPSVQDYINLFISLDVSEMTKPSVINEQQWELFNVSLWQEMRCEPLTGKDFETHKTGWRNRCWCLTSSSSLYLDKEWIKKKQTKGKAKSGPILIFSCFFMCIYECQRRYTEEYRQGCRATVTIQRGGIRLNLTLWSHDFCLQTHLWSGRMSPSSVCHTKENRT